MIRLFTLEDYEEAYELWKRTPGVRIREVDDSKEGIAKLIKRNPTTNFVAAENGMIVGTVLSGHDGRRGYLYHTCVDELHRHKSIGRQLVEHVITAMKEEEIYRLSLFCLGDNNLGNHFWSTLGWTLREDLNLYSFVLEDNK
jgi:ribosomal protein S18 acetylase RimI-like enzyme